jgi:hypothetical protein
MGTRDEARGMTRHIQRTISLSDLGLRCTHDADNTVRCSKFHDAAATNTISPIVT